MISRVHAVRAALTLPFLVDTQDDASLAQRATADIAVAATAGLDGGSAPSVISIDGYSILGTLGQGGMGAVYEARQESTGRRVAIKVMLDSAVSSETGRKRFEREVEIVARLEHPGIISIIDSGVRRGQYYFVMEFVEGRPLDEVVRPGACDVRSAIALVADVCDVVDYAHQRAILHRDLKPGNVLVESGGRVRLLDFGIAQVLDDKAVARETVSRPGQVVGTVAYMSPEQAAGKISDLSVRTDVYALGAIAYELITGRPPFPLEGSITQALLRIVNDEPVAPSRVRQGIPRDVDAMLLKAMEKQPSRRYATSGEFGADLRRFLQGEPVLARPVGPAGRTWRWVRRNRTVSAVGAVSLLVLAGVSTGLVWRIVQERDRAVQNFAQLKGVLESALQLQSTDGGGTIPQLMDRAVQGLDHSPSEDLKSEADIREIIGGVYRNFGVYSKAEAIQRRVLATRKSLASGDEKSVADAMHNLAATLWWDGKYAEAEPLYVESLAMRRRLFKGDDPAVAFSLTHLAACRLRLGKLKDAQELYKLALEMRVRLYGSSHEQVAQALNNLAKCELETESLDDAEGLFRSALEMITKIRGENNLGTASASANLGECLLLRAREARLEEREDLVTKRAEEALALYRKAFEIRSGIFSAGHPLTASSLGGMARAWLLLGKVVEADAAADRGRQMFLKTERAIHPDFIDLLSTNAMTSAALGNLDPAREKLEQALAVSSSLRTTAQVQLAELNSELGGVLVALGKRDFGLSALIAAPGPLVVAASERERGLSLLKASVESLAAARGESSLVAKEAAERLRAARSQTTSK